MKKLSTTIFLVALLGGVVLTAWGLAHLSWPQALPWADKNSLLRYGGFIVSCTALVLAGAYWSKLNPLTVGAIVAVLLGLLSGSLWSMVVLGWFVFSALILGDAVLPVLGDRTKSKNCLIALLIGAGIYGTVVGLIAHFPVSYPGVYGAALALPILIWQEKAKSYLLGFWGVFSKKSVDSEKTDKLGVAVAVVGLIHFVVALMPELGHDALAMHLFIPSHMATRHQWGFDADTYVWAVMPMLGDWIFSVGYLLGGETATRLINVGFIFLLALLVRELVSWAGGSTKGAQWAALIFLSSPLTFTESSSLFIESVWSSFVVSGTLLLCRLDDGAIEAKSKLLIAGVLLGFGAAAKAVTLTILPVLALIALWHYKFWRISTKPSNWLVAVSLFLLVALIPYITAWRLTGNPVFPFFNGIFKSTYYPPVNFDSASVFGKGLTWDVLYRATFNSSKYLEATAGVPGFQWLLLFLPSSLMLVATKQLRGIALLVIGVLIVAVVFQSVSYLRYVFPAWVILAAVMGLVLGNISSEVKLVKVVWGGATIGAVALNLLFFSASAFYRDFPLSSILDKSQRNQYLQNRLPIRNVVELVNRLNVSRSPVAVFSNPLSAGLEADALYSNWYNFHFQNEINAAGTVDTLASTLFRRGVDYVILDSAWSGGAVKRALIEKATTVIAEQGTISVRKVNNIYQFQAELLKNPEFTSTEGWSLSPGAAYDSNAKVVTVSVISPITQAIAVSPGQRYLNVVVARCDKKPTVGRVQINWLNESGQFISTNIKTFDCMPDWTEQTMEVTAPLSAKIAIVYTTSHTSTPVQFRKNSLR
ncbi:MAG: glycosyl transferase [Betaproteobacteria bacterium]|nr:glycosyl transferase [Betaproteobacteria bacterium]